MMKLHALAVALIGATMITACSQPASQDTPVAPADPKITPGEPARAVPAEPAPASTEMPAPAPAAEPAESETLAAPPAAPATAVPPVDGNVNAADGAADPQHQKLVGTKWKISDFDVQFKDATTVHLNGGPLTMMTAGKGLDATYKYDNGAIEINAMGQTKNGTWDGEKLVVDGTAAEKQ